MRKLLVAASLLLATVGCQNKTPAGPGVVKITLPASTAATFAFSPLTPEEEQDVRFDAAGSTSGVAIVSYRWDFGDGKSSTGVTTTHGFTPAGDYQVTLTVTDDEGREARTSQTITVKPKVPTVATFVFAPLSPEQCEVVNFNASGSAPGSGRTIVSYSWDFGDGETKTGVTTTHDFTAAGDYLVTLTVTDSKGEETMSAQTLTVRADPTGCS
jgi:PKD repeat protein